MRIMLDTNVLISIFIFKSQNFGRLLSEVCTKHQLVLSSYTIDELYRVIGKKFPKHMASVEAFLAAIPFEMELTPKTLPEHGWFTIRDAADEKVLYSAITADIDVLVTGDKDFFDIPIEKPEILTPGQFLIDYC